MFEMDHQDQEVVREPFEPSEYFDDFNQTIEDEKINNHEDEKLIHNVYHHPNSPSPESSQNYKSHNLANANTTDTTINKKPICDKLMNSKYLLSDQESSKEIKLKTSITTDCIYHKGTFYQKGDIVAICDQDDGLLYFAQLAGFLQDQYCEKSASLNWLVPTRPTSRDFFDPSAYKIGFVDSQLRKLDCMTFVRHCPHDYYFKKLFQMDQNEQSQEDESATNKKRYRKGPAYIWTTMEPCPVPVVEKKIQSE